MELSSEDVLRLNVLLANKPKAIRIDESSMSVFGLTENGETRVSLNPVGRDEAYLRKVRELLSGHVLGFPGGYPVYLKRWTRMGQMRDESLEQLLLLGEPEAVVAAVCARGLSDELARRAWWAMPDPENARRLLSNPAVVQGGTGKLLADYLLDYLPFETEPESMIESVRLMLQPGLIDAAAKQDLWKKAKRKQAVYVGFLAAVPEELPVDVKARGDYEAHAPRLLPLARSGDLWAQQTVKLLSAPGQAFLDTVGQVLSKPGTQEVVTITLDILADWFHPLRPEGNPDQVLVELDAEASVFCDPATGSAAARCLAAIPELAPELHAMRVLSGVGYGVVRPVLSGTTAIGSLMRRKLEPVVQPLMGHLAVLKGEKG